MHGISPGIDAAFYDGGICRDFIPPIKHPKPNLQAAGNEKAPG